jgi:hypothetical protein
MAIANYPGLSANSYFDFPGAGATMVFGGGFAGTGPEKAWAGINNVGPQTQFHFGRLTTTQVGEFAGVFYLRDDPIHVELPFALTLPGATGPLTEQVTVSGGPALRSGGDLAPPPEIEESLAPRPRNLKPSFGERLTSWKISLPLLPPPPTRIIGGTVTAIPEPTAWILAVAFVPLLLRRRAT